MHEWAIVNLDYVDRLKPSGHGEYRITLKDGTRITLSRTYNEALRCYC